MSGGVDKKGDVSSLTNRELADVGLHIIGYGGIDSVEGDYNEPVFDDRDFLVNSDGRILYYPGQKDCFIPFSTTLKYFLTDINSGNFSSEGQLAGPVPEKCVLNYSLSPEGDHFRFVDKLSGPVCEKRCFTDSSDPLLGIKWNKSFLRKREELIAYSDFVDYTFGIPSMSTFKGITSKFETALWMFIAGYDQLGEITVFDAFESATNYTYECKEDGFKAIERIKGLLIERGFEESLREYFEGVLGIISNCREGTL